MILGYFKFTCKIKISSSWLSKDMPEYAVACVLNNPDAVGHSRMIEKSSSDFAGSIATLTHFCA